MIKNQLNEILKEQILLTQQLMLESEDITNDENLSDLLGTQQKFVDLITTGTFIEPNTVTKNKASIISENKYDNRQQTEITNTEQSSIAENSISVEKPVDSETSATMESIIAKFITKHTGGILYTNSDNPNIPEAIRLNEATIRSRGIKNDDDVEIKIPNIGDPIIVNVLHNPNPRTSKYVDIDAKVKMQQNNLYIDENLQGDTLNDLIGLTHYMIPEPYIKAVKPKVGDTLTVRYDSDNPKRLYCVYLERYVYQNHNSNTENETPATKPKKEKVKESETNDDDKYHNEWTFDLNGRTIGVVGGGVFHDAWENFITENNGKPNFIDSSGKKLRGLTSSIKSVVDKSDMTLLCQNMINHPTANAIRKYAKSQNKPCESFTGFSANQIFDTIRIIDNR